MKSNAQLSNLGLSAHRYKPVQVWKQLGTMRIDSTTGLNETDDLRRRWALARRNKLGDGAGVVLILRRQCMAAYDLGIHKGRNCSARPSEHVGG